MGEKAKVYAAWAVLVSFGAVLFYLFFKYAFGVFLPFLLGYLIALAARRPAAVLHKRCRLSEGVCRLVIALSLAVTVGVLLFFSVKVLAKEIGGFVDSLGEDLPERIEAYFSRLPFFSSLWQNGQAVESLASSLLSFLPSFASGLIKSLPRLLFAIGVGGIASVYFCLGLEEVHAAVTRLIPSRLLPALRKGKKHLTLAFLALLRSNGILMLIAFAFMFVGFLLLRVPYPLLLAAVFSLFDLLPVIGVGAFLVPMGLFRILAGDTGTGVGILILFIVIAVVRQLAEPRILGAGQGVPPLLTLFSLYAGARLFGTAGLIFFPVILLLLYSLFVSGEEKKKGSP